MAKFTPQETAKANYDQGIINWSYVTFKYDTPFGPKVSKYDPYYTYNVDINVGGQQVAMPWYPSVDEHKIIQLTGATKGTVIAVTYVKEEKRRGLIAMYSSGPQAARDPIAVDAEISAGLVNLAPKQEGQGEQLPGVLLPPAPPQIPPPPGAPTPPPPPQATAPAASPPPPTAPQVPPPQAPPPSNSQPPRKPSTMNGEQEPDYRPRKDNVRVMEVLNAMADDMVYVRRLAWDKVEETFADVLPTPPDYAKPNKGQQMEIAQVLEKRASLILGLSAPVNIGLDKQVFRVYKSGQSLAKEGVEDPNEPEEVLSAETKEGALEMINRLSPDNYNNPVLSLTNDWLAYTAEPHEKIGSWKHAANICKIFGLDKQVLIDDFDADNLLTYTQAIWEYEDHRQLGESRNETLEYIAEHYGIAPEQMLFEEEVEASE